MTVEIEITKSDLEALRRRMGIKSRTNAGTILKSLVTVVVSDEHALIYSQYEN